MVSIIIPVYNSQDYLKLCLDSVLRQTFEDFECIMVDDGSTDESLSICELYQKRDGRFHAYHKPNGGVSSARNFGIDKAKGEYLYFMDSDDEILENGLGLLIAQMNEETDLAFGNFITCSNDGNDIHPNKKILSARVSAPKALDILAYHGNYYLNLGMPWLNLFKRAIIVENNLRYNETFSIFEDLLFLTSYIVKCKGKVSFNNKATIYRYYYMRANSIMNTRGDSFRIGTLRTLDARISIMKVAVEYGRSCKMIYQSQLAVYYTYHELISYIRKFNREDLESDLRKKVDNALSRPMFLFFTIRDKFKRLFRKLM